MLAWVLGGAAAMLFMGLSLNSEMASFPGGPEALARSVMPAVEAMRPLRWPADRLDTLGGYLTFHNVVLFSGFLAIYAAIQGARAVRGPEERHSLDDVLAAGWSRTGFLRDRALGFAVVLGVTSLGLAAGIAWALAASDQPDLAGSLITMASVGLGALAAYTLALLVSQLVRSAKAAAGIAVLVLVAMYLVNNVADLIGPFGVLRYLTTFHWVNQSRALVPGEGLDLVAMLVLLAASVTLLALAAMAFTRRDCGSVLWPRRMAQAACAGSVRVRHWWTHAYWTAHLRQHWLGLLAWTTATAAFAALMVSLQRTVTDAWSEFDYITRLLGTGNMDLLYTGFITDILAPVVVAYAITQAAGWTVELDQGRVEAMLSGPMSWSRLVWERLLATGVGIVVITLGTLATVIVGSTAINGSVDMAGMLRVVAMCLLIGWAVAGVAALAVAAIRSNVAVTLLAVYVGAAYLLTWLIPTFEWPTWVEHFSVFMAFGHPYQEWPAAGGLVLLATLALGGSVAAAAVAERTPKVGSA